MSLDVGRDDRDRQGEHMVLARGLLLEAVDCIGSASLLIGDDEARAPLTRCAEELHRVAGGLAREPEEGPRAPLSTTRDEASQDCVGPDRI